MEVAIGLDGMSAGMLKVIWAAIQDQLMTFHEDTQTTERLRVLWYCSLLGHHSLAEKIENIIDQNSETTPWPFPHVSKQITWLELDYMEIKPKFRLRKEICI